MLSKSQYIRGLQCHKSLWLRKNKPNLRNMSTDQTESLFATGLTVGDCAKTLFPDGIEIEFTPDDFNSMFEKTSKLIEEGVDTIYEAAFQHKGVFVMVDILHKTDGGWNVYEVKSSTKVKPHYVDDAAVQYYALKDVVDLNKVSIIHINNKYNHQVVLDLTELFTIEDITVEVIERQEGVKSNLDSMELMLKLDVPDIDIGTHCSKQNGCDFSDHCWQHIKAPSVFNLYRMNGQKKFDLYNGGIVSFEDIPADFKLNKIQQVQVNSILNNTVLIDKDIINDFIETIEYPISYFDFETFQNAIPRFKDQRPYMQMPFQYSLHIVNENGEMNHEEFLGDENSDPRRQLSERMLCDIPKTGSIMAYNQSFEISRIKELAKLFPDLYDELMELTDRFVDLIVPFRKLGYYHPDFNGSFSIKSVLPALFPDDPELDYKKLGIQNGGMAMDTYANLYLLKDRNKREKIRDDLLAYCHLDTLAMIRIFEKLQCLAV